MRPVRADRVTDAELAAARASMEPVLDTATPHLDRLFRTVDGLGGCVVLADRHGLALDRRGHAGDDRDFADAGLWTGTFWSERHAGTNAIGTCLVEGRSVTIHRDQHFLADNIRLSCSSAPVHDAHGALVAVIDVSTARDDLPDALAQLIAQTVGDTARRVESDLFAAAFPRARIVLVPGVDRGAAALLAVDADDLVIGASHAARVHLALPNDLAAAPRPLGDLLGLPGHDRIEDAERAVLTRALARAEGNVSAASRALGLSRATLHRKLAHRRVENPRDLSQP